MIEPPGRSESATSSDAARSIKSHVETLRMQVLKAVVKTRKGGLTCDEYEEMSGLAHQTASARFNELVKLGRIIPTCRMRETRHGRQAFVYVAVAFFCAVDQKILIAEIGEGT